MKSIIFLTKIKLFIFIFLGMLYACTPESAYVYVATDGSDLNEGTLNHPFATITKAREVIRDLNKQGKNKSFKVMIREGTYYLPETFQLLPEDSGNDGNPVIYTNYKNEKVTISGSIKLDCQWQLYSNGIYKCNLSENNGLDFSQLFVNCKRQTRARYPNGKSLQPNAESFVFPNKTDEWPHVKIYFNPQTFSNKKWQRPEEAILHVFNHHHWGNLQYRITGIDYDESTIHIEQRDPQINDIYFSTWGGRPATYLSERSKFFVDNVFEELDVEGEWYFDKHEAILYYKPYDTLDIETAVIEVPALRELVSIKGSKDSPVKNISFKNVRFTGTRATYMDSYEYPSLGDWGIVRSGAILIEGAESISIEDCFFDAVGGNAVFINHYANSINVTGNIFTGCGESAVCLVGESHLNFDKTYNCQFCGASHPWGWDEPSREIPSNCVIHNNLIYDIGEFGKQVAGVFLALSKKNTISHNHIYNTPRAAICFNDGWHGGHIVEFNDIHHTVRETGDHGPFNSWGRESFWCDKQSHGRGVSHPAGDVLADAKHTTLIRNNRFTDNSGWGIDLDDGSSNYHVYNNLCIGVSVKLREGDYRTVENNIFYKGANPPSYHRGYEDNTDIFRKNIVIVDTLRYNPTEDVNFFARVTRENVFHFIAPPEQSKWIAVVDSNIYFSSTGKFTARVNAAGRNIGFDGEYMELDEWKNMGFDHHSIIADPLFRDPIRGDFKLDSNSPAFEIGFKEFAMDRFGLTHEFKNIWIK